MRKYLIPSTIITLLLLGGYFTLNETLLNGFLHTYFVVLILFFFLQSFPVAWLLKNGAKDPSQFPVYVIGAVTFRFLTGLFLLVIFYALKTPSLNLLMIQFVGVYLVYLIFELIVVLANLRRN